MLTYGLPDVEDAVRQARIACADVFPVTELFTKKPLEVGSFAVDVVVILTGAVAIVDDP
jgi:hypothetical protein